MGSLIVSPYGVQAIQVLTILLGAPLVSGFIAHVEGRLQGRRGPRILQPYYDIASSSRRKHSSRTNRVGSSSLAPSSRSRVTSRSHC